MEECAGAIKDAFWLGAGIGVFAGFGIVAISHRIGDWMADRWERKNPRMFGYQPPDRGGKEAKAPPRVP